MKKILTLLIMILFCIMLTQVIPGNQFTLETNASSIKKTTKKAKASYMRKINKLSKNYKLPVFYKVVNIIGNKVPELMVIYEENNYVDEYLVVYTYKKGKIQRLLKTYFDNPYNDEYYSEDYSGNTGYITLYKKTKTFVIITGSPGNEYFHYFKYFDGKFRLKAIANYSDGGDSYQNSHEKTIHRSRFRGIVRKLEKGKKTIYNYKNWARQ